MFNKFTKPLSTILVTVILAGCASAPSDGYDRALHRKAAGAAIVSGFAQLCGARGIDQYRDSFVATMRSQQEVSPAAETKIRALFVKTDGNIAGAFPDAAARNTHCSKIPADQSVIDRGIAGDFTGQI